MRRGRMRCETKVVYVLVPLAGSPLFSGEPGFEARTALQVGQTSWKIEIEPGLKIDKDEDKINAVLVLIGSGIG